MVYDYERDPALMNPAERRTAIAQILAVGCLRLLSCKGGTPPAESCGNLPDSRPPGLENPGKVSLHVSHVVNSHENRKEEQHAT